MKYIFNILLVSILFIGCTTPKEIIREVPVEVTREVEKNVYIHDSIYKTDSVITYQKGDTIFKEKIIYKYVSKTVHDTLATHDTIPHIINTETTITNTVYKPQWWPVWLSLGIVLLYFLITKTKFIQIIKNLIKLFK